VLIITSTPKPPSCSLKPVIGIHLLNFDLFTQPEQLNQAHWCFEMRDRWQPSTKLGAELELGKLEGLQDALNKMMASGISETQARSILGL